MALTPEQIDSAYRVVWTTVPHRERLSAFARAIESEVRKQDTELIRQLVEALNSAVLQNDCDMVMTGEELRRARSAIALDRARLEGKSNE